MRRRVVSASSRRRACDPEEFEALSHERAGQEIIANLSAAEPTGLAICNTVASAIKLTGELDDAAMIAGYNQIALGEVYDSLARRDDASFTPDKDETITECRAEFRARIGHRGLDRSKVKKVVAAIVKGLTDW